jgi:bleomycin hydrolase
MTVAITPEMIRQLGQKYISDRNNKLMESIITLNGLKKVALNKEAINKNVNVFSIELPKVKITNQKKSGRCWAFAGLNLLKREMAKNLNIDIETFELSQNYITFYDKLEKANTFYETMIDFHEKELMDRELLFILDCALYQGGTPQFFSELIKKYGIVPKAIMPETKDSEDADVLTDILSTKVRKDAIRLRQLCNGKVDTKELGALKQQMLQEVYNILCKTLGQPPEKFKFEYYDRDKKYNIIDSITPVKFYEQYIDISVDDYVMIGNVPMHNKQYGKLYKEKEYIANIIGLSNQYFLNLEISDFKDLVVKSLKNGEPVYFGGNVSKMSSRDFEIFDDDIYDFNGVLGIDLKMTKSEMLDYREISAEHMMVFTGVNMVDNTIDRWKVENSWGDKKHNKGFFIMSDSFFDQYVLECVINKKYLSDDQQKLLQQEPIIFEAWDPMH